MGQTPMIIAKLRMLASAQVIDEKWLSEVGGFFNLDVTKLTIDYWNNRIGAHEYGPVKYTSILNDPGIQWERPDGGMPMFVADKVPQCHTLGRFLCFAKIIKLLPKIKEASFAKVGQFTEFDYSRCKVFLNGNEIEKVISADAILGVVEYHKRDKSGNLIFSEDKETIEIQRISGIVQIKIMDERQSFF